MEGDQVGGVEVAAEPQPDAMRHAGAQAGVYGDAAASVTEPKVTSRQCYLCGVEQGTGLHCGLDRLNEAAFDCLPKITQSARQALNAVPGPIRFTADPATAVAEAVARMWTIADNRDEPPAVRVAALQSIVNLPTMWRV